MSEVPTYSKMSCHYFSSPVNILCRLSSRKPEEYRACRHQNLLFFWTRGPFHPQPSRGSVILMCCADTALPGTIFQSVPVILVVSEEGDRKMESDSTAEGDVPESMLCTKHLLMVK